MISVVTPSFNSAATIARALDSVRAQSYPHIESIVIDGGSRDGTRDLLQARASDFAHWVSEPDRGIADAFNKGIKAARGSLIGILNADDWLEPGALDAVMAVHRCHPDAVIHGDMRFWMAGGRSFVAPRRPRVSLAKLPYHPATFVPASLYARHGLFDDAFRYAMDTDLLVRFYRAGVEFVYLPQVLANMSSGGVSTGQAAGPYRERREIYRRAGMNFILNHVLYAFFVSRMQARIWIEKLLPG